MKQSSYNKIIVPYDGSKIAQSILPELLAIASAFDPSIILLQVIESPIQINAKISPSPFISTSYSSLGLAGEMYQQEKTAAENHLHSLTKKLYDHGLTKVSQIIAEGNPGDEIVKHARHHKCDLIVMSTHGRSGLGRVLLGSVADQVIHNAHCPVLLIRPKSK